MEAGGSREGRLRARVNGLAGSAAALRVNPRVRGCVRDGQRRRALMRALAGQHCLGRQHGRKGEGKRPAPGTGTGESALRR